MLFTVAVAHAVTIFAAPGPTEDAQGMILLRLLCFANAVATWHMPCSFLPWRTLKFPGFESSASPNPTAIPCPNMVKNPSTNFVSLPSMETYWLSRNFTIACATVILTVLTISFPLLLSLIFQILICPKLNILICSIFRQSLIYNYLSPVRSQIYHLTSPTSH